MSVVRWFVQRVSWLRMSEGPLVRSLGSWPGEYLKILCVKMDFGVRGPHSARWGSPEEYKKLDSSGTDVWL